MLIVTTQRSSVYECEAQMALAQPPRKCRYPYTTDRKLEGARCRSVGEADPTFEIFLRLTWLVRWGLILAGRID
ncbi:hypothetical protein [Sphingomonas sp. PB4P5]|uniref:hypothetical protein n=1 Tax=Parasphingomonas puruogangriensis TaxID=3096155 RepID=UPI002FCA434E